MDFWNSCYQNVNIGDKSVKYDEYYNYDEYDATYIGDNEEPENLLSIDLTKVKPKHLNIPANCFEGCYNLTKITLPSNCKKLGDYCFNECEKLEIINSLSKLRSIGKFCFNKCSNLKSITLPNITKLGDCCFNRCSNLTSVELSSSLDMSDIGKGCFSECKNATVYIPLPPDEIQERKFSGCKKINCLRQVSGGDIKTNLNTYLLTLFITVIIISVIILVIKLTTKTNETNLNMNS